MLPVPRSPLLVLFQAWRSAVRPPPSDWPALPRQAWEPARCAVMHMLDGAGPFKRPLLELRGLLFEFFGKPECRTATRALQIAVTKMPWHAIKTMSYAGAVRDHRRWIDPGNFIYSVFWMLAGYMAANLRETSTAVAAEVRDAAAEFREVQKRAEERWPRAGNSPRLPELFGDLVELVLSSGGSR